MKRFILLLMLVFTSAGCGYPSQEGYRYDHLLSYLPFYYDGDLIVECVPRDPWTLNVKMSYYRRHCFAAPEVGGEGESAARFLEIAERNGDRSYNKSESDMNYGNRPCFADNFKSIQVVCLTGDWDSAHPAGTSLNDIAQIKYTTYANYIRSGYTLEKPREAVCKRLSELTEEDLTMIDINFSIVFDHAPAGGSYHFQITMVTTDGKEKVGDTGGYKHPDR